MKKALPYFQPPKPPMWGFVSLKWLTVSFLLVILGCLTVGCKCGFSASNGPLTEKLTQNCSIELIYQGTNETLSEALYRSDLRDGKLDEPHIIFSVLKWDEYGAATKAELRFINEQNNVVRSFVEEGEGNIKNLFVSDDGKIGSVIEKNPDHYLGSEVVYDANGALLCRRLKPAHGGWAPDHSYFVTFPNPEYLNLPPYEIGIHDRYNKVIGAFKYDPKGPLPVKVAFSDNGDHCAVLFQVDLQVTKIMVFNRSGHLVRSVDMSGDVFLDRSKNVCMSKDGSKLYFIAYDSKGWQKGSLLEGRDQYLIILNANSPSEIIYTSKEIQDFGLSPDEKHLALVSENEAVLFDLGKGNSKKVVYNGDLYEKFKWKLVDASGETNWNLLALNDLGVLYFYFISDGVVHQLNLALNNTVKTLFEIRGLGAVGKRVGDKIVLMSSQDKQREYISGSIYIFKVNDHDNSLFIK